METQLKAQLDKLAHSILANDTLNTEQLKEKARLIYEQLCVLAYAEKHETKTATAQTNVPKKGFHSVVEVKEFVDTLENKEEINVLPILEPIVTTEAPVIEEKIISEKVEETPNLLHELADLTADFDLPEFEPKEQHESAAPTTVNSTQAQKSSLNDTLKRTIQFGLNDRLAFVKHLFDGNQDDFTRVLSQLNTLDSDAGARNFIKQMVKPEYNNWEGKEEYEERFMEVVFRKFTA